MSDNGKEEEFNPLHSSNLPENVYVFFISNIIRCSSLNFSLSSYCRKLEENSFRGRTSDFVLMFIFGAFCMLLCAFFVNLLFLGEWYRPV